MSAQAFQTLMANLIRHPTTPLAKLRDSLGSLELTEKEETQLEKMAHDPLVRKFGYKMSLCRRRDATEIMKLSKDFIEEEVLNEMYYRHFEPTRSSTDLVMLGVQFLEFALSSPECQALLKDSPPFVRDLMLYDLAKGAVLREVVKLDGTGLPPNTLLLMNAFRVIDLDYDVPAVDQMKTQNPSSKKKPAEKKIKVLFMRAPLAPYYRMFQIDDSVADFLQAQRENPAGWLQELPKPFSAMVKVGLCRAQDSTTPGAMA